MEKLNLDQIGAQAKMDMGIQNDTVFNNINPSMQATNRLDLTNIENSIMPTQDPLTLKSSVGQLIDHAGYDLKSFSQSDPNELLKKQQSKGFDAYALGDAMAQSGQVQFNDPFQDFKASEGNFRSLAVKNMSQNLDRYEKSGSDINEIAFNPLRNNEALYTERMTNLQDIRRAFSGAWLTAKLGFYDSLGIGSIIDSDSAQIFENANKLGASSKSGFVGMASNLVVSAGYTAGIMAELGVEGLVLAGIEGASLTSGVGAAAGTSLVIGRVADKMNKLRKAITNLSKASAWKTAAKNSLKALNPVQDLMDFRKATLPGGAKNALKGWQKAVGYGTNTWRGMNKIKWAYEESALEAGTTFNETRQKAIDKYYEQNGVMPDDEWLRNLDEKSKAASYNTFLANFPLIYGTNALVFDNMLRPQQFKTAVRRAGTDTGVALIKENGKRQAIKYPGSFWKKAQTMFAHPKFAANVLRQNAKEYIADNTLEGLQEVFQDYFQNQSQRKFSDMMKGDESMGSYFNYLLSSPKDLISDQSLESFASGFFMQMLVSPVAKVSASMSNASMEPLKGSLVGKAVGLVAEKGGNIKDRIVNREEINKEGGFDKWKAKQELSDTEKQRKKSEQEIDEDIKLLNDYFNDPLKFLNPALHEQKANKQLDQYMNQRAVEGDSMGYKDTYRESMYNNLSTLLDYGALDYAVESMNDVRDNTIREDFEKEGYGISYDDYIAEIERTKEYAKNIQSKHDNIEEYLPNPFHPEEIKDKDSEEYKNAVMGYYAWKQAQRDIVWNQINVEDALDNIKEIAANLNGSIPLNKTPYTVLSTLTSSYDTYEEIGNLEQELNGIKDNIDEEDIDPILKKQIKEKKVKLNDLKELNKLLDNAGLARLCGKDLPADDSKKLKQLLTDYINTETKRYGDLPPMSNYIDNVMDDLIKSREYQNRAEFATRSANILMDPEGFKKRVEQVKEFNKKTYEARQTIIKKSLEKFRQEMEKYDIMKKLHALGVFYDPSDHEKYLGGEKKRIPPLYRFNTNMEGIENIEELKVNTDLYKKAVDIFKEVYPDITGAQFAKGRTNYFDSFKTNDNRGFLDLNKEYEFKFNPEGVSVMSLKDFIVKMRQIANVDSIISSSQLALAEAMEAKLGGNFTIRFKMDMNNSEPIVIDDKGNLFIDPRFSSREYDDAFLSFETLVLRGLLTKAVDSTMKVNQEFQKRMADLFDEVRPILPEVLKDQIKDEAIMASAALTSPTFARWLNSIESKVEANARPRTVWQKFIDTLMSFFDTIGGRSDNSVYNGILNNLNLMFPENVNVEGTPVVPPSGPVDEEEMEVEILSPEEVGLTKEPDAEIKTEDTVTEDDLNINYDDLTDEEKKHIDDEIRRKKKENNYVVEKPLQKEVHNIDDLAYNIVNKPDLIELDEKENLIQYVNDKGIMDAMKKPGRGVVQSEMFCYNTRSPFDPNRIVVVVNIDGKRLPFYISSSAGGKKNVPAGHFYPFFGMTESGWLNKTNESDINNSYGCELIRSIQKQLDEKYKPYCELIEKNSKLGSKSMMVDQTNRSSLVQGLPTFTADDPAFLKELNKDLNPISKGMFHETTDEEKQQLRDSIRSIVDHANNYANSVLSEVQENPSKKKPNDYEEIEVTDENRNIYIKENIYTDPVLQERNKENEEKQKVSDNRLRQIYKENLKPILQEFSQLRDVSGFEDNNIDGLKKVSDSLFGYNTKNPVTGKYTSYIHPETNPLYDKIFDMNNNEIIKYLTTIFSNNSGTDSRIKPIISKGTVLQRKRLLYATIALGTTNTALLKFIAEQNEDVQYNNFIIYSSILSYHLGRAQRFTDLIDKLKNVLNDVNDYITKKESNQKAMIVLKDYIYDLRSSIQERISELEHSGSPEVIEKKRLFYSLKKGDKVVEGSLEGEVLSSDNVNVVIRFGDIDKAYDIDEFVETNIYLKNNVLTQKDESQLADSTVREQVKGKSLDSQTAENNDFKNILESLNLHIDILRGNDLSRLDYDQIKQYNKYMKPKMEECRTSMVSSENQKLLDDIFQLLNKIEVELINKENGPFVENSSEEQNDAYSSEDEMISDLGEEGPYNTYVYNNKFIPDVAKFTIDGIDFEKLKDICTFDDKLDGYSQENILNLLMSGVYEIEPGIIENDIIKTKAKIKPLDLYC